MVKMKNQLISCPICMNKKISSLSQFPVYNYCYICQIAWLKDSPKDNYQKNYYQGSSSTMSKLFYPLSKLFYLLRSIYVKGAKKTLWIDIGAGEGEYLKIVNASRKIGIEISTAGREIMLKKRLEIMTPQQFLTSKNLKASIISYWHVLEHIDKPRDYLLTAQKNLANNGKIIIGLPNLDSWEFRIFGKYWFHLAPKYHIWHFSPLAMKKILEKTGFIIERIDYWSPEHHLAGLVQSLINYTSHTQDVLHKLIKRRLLKEKIPLKGILASIFWLTLGLPIIILFWVSASIFHKSGTIVIVASKN